LPLLYRSPIEFAEGANDETTASDHVQKTAGANNQTACDYL
jgi:hypothetical protein